MGSVKEIGDLLRRRREELGLSHGDVYDRIKVRPTYLAMLEEGRFDGHPGEVYFRGFLRSYGDFLGLDGASLVQRYKELRQQQEELLRRQAEERARSEKRGKPGRTVPARVARWCKLGGRLPTWVLVVLLALVAVGLVLLVAGLRKGGMGRGPADGQDAEAEDTAGSAQSTQSGDYATVAQAAVESGPGPGSGPVGEPSGGEGPAGHTLAVRATARCWVRVMCDGTKAYEGVLVKGRGLEFTFRSQAQVRLGNGGGAILTCDGIDHGPLGADGEVMDVTWPSGVITYRSSRRASRAQTAQ